MNIQPPVCGTYTAITATTTVCNGNGALLGILITSATTGIITINDGSNTIMPATASLTITTPTFIPIPACFNTSLVVTISGTVSATVIWTN